MRILIVDTDLVTSNKLNLLLSEFGECDVTSSGIMAVRMFAIALKAHRPFQLVTIDMEMKDIKGHDLLVKLKELEAKYPEDTGGPGAFILVLTGKSDHASILSALNLKCDAYVLKPFDRENIIKALRPLGLGDQSSSPLVTNPLSVKEERLGKLLAGGLEMEERTFCRLLGMSVEELGEFAESRIIQYVDTAAPGDRLLNRIVEVMGTAARTSFLSTLEVLAARPVNINLRKQSIVAIAKMDNEAAWRVLSRLQESANNAFLAKTISGEINTIQQKNPYLGLIPQFLQGQADLKTFKKVVELLKKIVKPSDLQNFTVYLEHEDPAIRFGAFEIICEKGAEPENRVVLAFTQSEIQKGLTEKSESSDLLSQLLRSLKKYAQTNQTIISPLLPDLQHLFEQSGDRQIREMSLQLLMSCPNKGFTEQVIELYRSQEGQRELAIQGLALSRQGIDFLISELSRKSLLQSKILSALAQSPAAVSSTLEIIPSLEREPLIQLLNGIPVGNYRPFQQTIHGLLRSEDREVCQAAMERVHENCDFDAESILFDKQLLKQYWTIPIYLNTIARIFPLQALHGLWDREKTDELSLEAARNQAEIINRILAFEPLLEIPERNHPAFLGTIRSQISVCKSSERLELLRLFQKLRCMDTGTLALFQEALNLYGQQREKHADAEEMQGIQACREYFNTVAGEVKGIEDGLKDLQYWINLPAFNYDILEKVVSNQPLAFYLKRKEVIQKLKNYLEATGGDNPEGFSKLFRKFPQLEAVLKAEPPPPRAFYLFFEKKGVLAIIQDQIRLLFPESEIRNQGNPGRNDIMLADYNSFYLLIAGSIKPEPYRLFVILNNPTEFVSIKTYNPVTFTMPISLFRIMRSILQEVPI